jgi:hypothetical protein
MLEMTHLYVSCMPHLVRLRISLSDHPGSLARVAAAIGAQGGNITAVDVHDAEAETAVDEITVDFPETPDFGQLREALDASGAATLQSHQVARAGDPVVQVLRRVVELLEGGPANGDELAKSVAQVCSSPAVWVTDAEGARHYEAGRFALERNGACTERTAALPEAVGAIFNGDAWLLAVPDPFGGNDRVVFVARPIELAFTATEITRIEALMALHDQLELVRRIPL